jgi:Fe2+ transport system protein FeoA
LVFATGRKGKVSWLLQDFLSPGVLISTAKRVFFLLTYKRYLFIIKNNKEKMKVTSLLKAPTNYALEVLKINAGDIARKRLISMGIHLGDHIIKYIDSSWCPVLVKNITLDSTKIAIGQFLADKIVVGYEEN